MIPRPLEVFLHSFLRERPGKTYLLAVSGGLDSMALFHAFQQVAPKLKITFTVAHIHHGPSSVLEQDHYRDQCLGFVQKECERLQVPFVFSRSQSPLKSSEQSLREHRLRQLALLKKQTAADYVVFSHHREDLLETRLLRLLRGTGPQGLQAMSEERGAVLRPFLSFSKEDLRLYLERLKSKWIEDPSNQKSSYLRNWVRNKWLPAVEKRSPGSVAALARSLESLAETVADSSGMVLESCLEDGRLLRSKILQMSESDKRRVLGQYLQSVGCKDYGLSHIREMIKRLDVERKDLTFRLLKRNWRANARHIWCEGENKIE